MSEIGMNIRRYRERNCYTQKEIADFLGCPREIISYYENGSRVPKVDILVKISDLFGVDVSDLLEESPDLVEENLVLAFRKQDGLAEDFDEIASFKRIIKNYMKMDRLTEEHGL